MNDLKYQIQGIYDLRTLKFLKSEGINVFGFDFNPRSFNFIQEHVFLDLLANHISENETVYLNFSNNSDYMIQKLIADIKSIRPDFKNLYFVFENVDESIINFNFPFIIKYSPHLVSNVFTMEFCLGMIISFKYFDNINSDFALEKFCHNLLFRYSKLFSRNLLLGLELSFSDNLYSSLFTHLDFNLVCLPINSEIEICYRNIDQQKLKKELNLKRKFITF